MPNTKYRKRSESESHSIVSYSLWPASFLCPWNSPGKNAGMGSHSLLQGIFPAQGLKPGLLHCRQTLLSKPPGKQRLLPYSDSNTQLSLTLFLPLSLNHLPTASEPQCTTEFPLQNVTCLPFPLYSHVSLHNQGSGTQQKFIFSHCFWPASSLSQHINLLKH